jgi:non-heme chloroperoxidase
MSPTAMTMFARSVTLSDELRLEYVERGNADGLPVIFLHGVTDSWGAFEGVLARLPDEFHAIALSQRGHGNSSRPAGGYRLADFAADVVRVLDALEIPRAVIVGHSMGSLVAQQFAISHPERTLGVVLMGSAPNVRECKVIQAYARDEVAGLTDPIDPAFAREFQVATIARPVAEGLIDACVLESLKVPARVWRDAFAGFIDIDFTDALRWLRVPVLVASGDRDGFFPLDHALRLHDLIPGSRLLVYEGGGHAFHWEDPDSFVRDLVGFLKSIRS